MKKLLAVSVSNIAYLRGLFNEGAFGGMWSCLLPYWLLIVLEFSQIAFWKVKNSRHSRPVSQTLIVARTDLPLKILKDKSGNPGACELIGWVKVLRF